MFGALWPLREERALDTRTRCRGVRSGGADCGTGDFSCGSGFAFMGRTRSRRDPQFTIRAADLGANTRTRKLTLVVQ